MDDGTGIGPYDATIAGVQALCPTVALLPELKIGQQGLTRDQVAGWIAELSSRTSLRLIRAGELAGDARRATVTAMARDAVHNAAASYVVAAAYSERAGKADTSYDQVLWSRYTEMLDDLDARVDAWIAEQDSTGTSDGVGPGGGAAGRFPAPVVTDELGF